MKKVLVVVLIICSIGAFAQGSKAEKVWNRSEALNNAIFVKKDSLALVDLVAKEVTYGHSTGAVEDKTTMIKNAIGNQGGYKNIEFERLAINVHHKTAVLRHNLRGQSLNAAGEGSPLNLQILQVWKKEHGKWRIWARQAVKIPAKS